MNPDLYYPIALDRINGEKIPYCPNWFFDGNNFIFPVEPAPITPKAATLYSGLNQEEQVACTGSDVYWNDVMFLTALDEVIAKNGLTVTFEQWPSFNGKNDWSGLIGSSGFQSLITSDILTLITLHEIMHTYVILPTEIGIPPLLYYPVSLGLVLMMEYSGALNQPLDPTRPK